MYKLQAHSPVIKGTFVHINVPVITASHFLWGIIVVITKVSPALPNNNKPPKLSNLKGIVMTSQIVFTVIFSKGS